MKHEPHASLASSTLLRRPFNPLDLIPKGSGEPYGTSKGHHRRCSQVSSRSQMAGPLPCASQGRISGVRHDQLMLLCGESCLPSGAKSTAALSCLKHLAAYRSIKGNPYTSKKYPLSRSAAVLVALFVGRWGDLYVLLSRWVVSLLYI